MTYHYSVNRDTYQKHHRQRRWHQQWHWHWLKLVAKWTSGIAIVFVILAIIGIIGLHVEMQSYLPLIGGSRIGMVCTTRTSKEYTLRVHLVLYGQNGHSYYDETSPVIGDNAQLQGIYIKYNPVLGYVGVISGYKLTRIEGYYNKAENERKFPHPPITLNNGEDQVFTTVQGQASVTPIINASYDKPFPLLPDGKTYILYATENGLVATVEPNAQPACGLLHP